MSILQMSLSVSTPPRSLSSWSVLSGENQLSLSSKLSNLSIYTTIKIPPIRMGGGPRTFPGGVSKWQWKRMQAKKAKQLLKARLARERQIYEMRKRAELKAAVAELERPWEVVERAPKLFSVGADEQVKVLADRFQKPGGFDMWSEKDGPQLFSPVDGFPSARFFPKGVVHSIKPYGKIGKDSNGDDKLCLPSSGSDPQNDVKRNGYVKSGQFGDNLTRGGRVVAKESVESSVDRNGMSGNGKFRKKGSRRRGGDEKSSNFNDSNVRRRGNGSQELRGLSSEVYDMSLQVDGTYGFKAENYEY